MAHGDVLTTTQYFRKRYKGSHGGLASADYGDEYGNNPGRGTWWNIYENDYSQKETSVRPTLVLTADLTDWMKFRAEGNYNYYYTRYESKKARETDMPILIADITEWDCTQKNRPILMHHLHLIKSVSDFTFGGFIRGEYYNNMQQTMAENTNGGLVCT